MMRSPLFRSQPSCSLIGTPMRTSALTPRGVSPSPQTFSRGNVAFSSTSTSIPARAR